MRQDSVWSLFIHENIQIVAIDKKCVQARYLHSILCCYNATISILFPIFSFLIQVNQHRYKNIFFKKTDSWANFCSGLATHPFLLVDDLDALKFSCAVKMMILQKLTIHITFSYDVYIV
jgi:hypothetical protein